MCRKMERSEMSLPAWGVWIEIVLMMRDMMTTVSLPAWGVWIEIITN